MRYLNSFFIASIFFALSSCSRLDCKPDKGLVIPGTDTAVVELRLDKNGYPQPNVEQVTVAPGQKIIFVGPNQFEILFKDNRSPIEQPEVRSANGIVTVEIPKNIFEMRAN